MGTHEDPCRLLEFSTWDSRCLTGKSGNLAGMLQCLSQIALIPLLACGHLRISIELGITAWVLNAFIRR